ncbi:biopolymer transporter ExbD [candidate division KSB1 bacterium]|nr:biopolymer transporter ExbD [candidate division KSB1 bacterium]
MAFIPSRIKFKKYEKVAGSVSLNLTSMMDMFTIILVFLLKTYSTEGQLIQPSQNLTLPNSTSQTAAEVALDLTVSKEWIMVNNRPVMQIGDIIADPTIGILEPVQKELLEYAKEAKRMDLSYGIPFTGKVTIQGDKNLPFSMISKVMATCGESEYPNMRLVVYQSQK